MRSALLFIVAIHSFHVHCVQGHDCILARQSTRYSAILSEGPSSLSEFTSMQAWHTRIYSIKQQQMLVNVFQNFWVCRMWNELFKHKNPKLFSWGLREMDWTLTTCLMTFRNSCAPQTNLVSCFTAVAANCCSPHSISMLTATTAHKVCVQ